jgi:betaine-aldehyde dehydrogenase
VLVHDRLYIGGDWVVPAGSGTLEVVSPYTVRPVTRVPEASTADVDRAVAAAGAAFDSGPWPRTPPAGRADVLRDLGPEGLRLYLETESIAVPVAR